jgi:hypothetical protein
VKYGSELPPAEQAVLMGVSDVLANLIHQRVPLMLYLIGTFPERSPSSLLQLR